MTKFKINKFNILVTAIVMIIGLFSWHNYVIKKRSPFIGDTNRKGTQPLIMRNGNPYIRALMRTISASESNYTRPYNVIYGGKFVENLSRHPNICQPINTGPNKGNCSTAAGRYQYINTTWQEKAKLYHPQPPGIMFWQPYNFEPEYQDTITYKWLSDPQAWKGKNIPDLLNQGEVNQVLCLLSPTWTSLPCGIEKNLMTFKLRSIYDQMLAEEKSKNPVDRPTKTP
jgi:muramidase (phage lysozyme)